MPNIPGIVSQAVCSSKEILLGTVQLLLPVIFLICRVHISRAICSQTLLSNTTNMSYRSKKFVILRKFTCYTAQQRSTDICFDDYIVCNTETLPLLILEVSQWPRVLATSSTHNRHELAGWYLYSQTLPQMTCRLTISFAQPFVNLPAICYNRLHIP